MWKIHQRKKNIDELRFYLEVKSSTDGKSNLTSICITSIATADGRTFHVPEEYQNAYHHKELIKTQKYTTITSRVTF